MNNSVYAEENHAEQIHPQHLFQQQASRILNNNRPPRYVPPK